MRDRLLEDRLLELELQILILRYGVGRVKQALGTISKGTANSLERESATERNERINVADKRGRQFAEDLIRKLFINRPQGARFAEEIVANFDSRKFLPERRDVQHFLSRLDSQKHFKSRAAALEPLIRALAEMSDGELVELSRASSSPKSDDYLLLARQIMKGTSENRD